MGEGAVEMNLSARVSTVWMMLFVAFQQQLSMKRKKQLISFLNFQQILECLFMA